MSTSRASLEELKDFANAVRAAGGGNPLDALMPAVPSDASQCLIAKNLNFNCMVNQESVNTGQGETAKWCMILDNQETRNNIASAMGLSPRNITSFDYGVRRDTTKYVIILPDRIGQVAADFDLWDDVQYNLEEWREAVEFARYRKKKLPRVNEFVSTKQLEWLQEFAPFIEQAVEEATLIGQLNEQGELVL